MAIFNAYYSKQTDIFYCKYKNQLYRFNAFNIKQTRKANVVINIEWIESDYKDMEGMSANWTKATPEQISTYSLDVKFKGLVDKLIKIGAIKL